MESLPTCALYMTKYGNNITISIYILYEAFKIMEWDMNLII